MKTIPENEISYKVRGCIFKVYNKLGPGLLESIYESALMIELEKTGLKTEAQVPFNVVYDDKNIGIRYQLDLLVEDMVIIEIKSVENLLPVHHKQLLTYLKTSSKRLGLLVNFNTVELDKNIVRIVNGLP